MSSEAPEIRTEEDVEEYLNQILLGDVDWPPDMRKDVAYERFHQTGTLSSKELCRIWIRENLMKKPE